MEALYRHFRLQVVRYITRGMGPQASRWGDPEDLAEEVLITILGDPSSLPPGLDESSLRARLLRTASNRIRDHVRKHRAHNGISSVPIGTGEVAVEQHSVSRQERRELLRELVERLPRKYREIVLLCGLEELSYAEVARRLRMNQDTVRKRYERARQVLAQRLQARGYGN